MSKEIEQSLKEKFNKSKYYILIEYLASRLKDEQTLVKYFNKEIIVKYRNLRRKEKCEELKQSMLDMIKTAKICLFYKDLVIELYRTRLNDFDELHKLTADNFLISKETLIENSKETLTNLKQNYLREVEFVKFTFKNEIKELELLNKERLKGLDDQIFCFNANAHEVNALEINALNLEYDELKTRYQDDRIVFKVECEKKVRQLELEYLNEKQTYENNLLCWRRPDAVNLKAELLGKTISKDKYRIQNLSNKLKEIKKEFSLYDFRLLEERKKFLNLKYKEYNMCFKKKNAESKNREAKLAKLVNQSTRAIEALREKHAKLKKIIILLKLCQKKEVNQNISFKADLQNDDSDLESLLNNLNKNINTPELNRLVVDEFTRNLNSINSNNAQRTVELNSLELAQSNLKEENIQLRQLLNEYIQCIKS